MGKVGKVKRRGESYSVFPTPFIRKKKKEKP
jgi:hypothetical protein